MSSTPFEKVQWELESYISYDNKELRKKLNDLLQEIKSVNRDNINLFIKTGNIEETQIYIGDMTYCEDYEILTGIICKDDEGNEFSTEEEYNKHLEEKQKEEFKNWTFKTIFVIDKIEYDSKEEAEKELQDDEEIELKFEIYNDEIFEDEFNTLQEVEEYIENEKIDWIEEQTLFEDLEKEYDEIYWNFAWKYYDDDINVEIAEQLGLVVIDVAESNNVDSGTYLTLGGCGMDLSPLLVAYQALAFGYIDSQYVSKLRTKNDRNYFRLVVGTENYKQVIEKLGIAELVKNEFED